MIIMVPTLEPLFIYTCIYIHMHICIGPPGGEVCIKVSPGNPHTPINCIPPPWRENEINHMHPPLQGNVGHFNWKCDT